MRLSEFQRAVAEEFGESYASVLIRDHWITALQGTAGDAMQRGVPLRDIWQHLCAEMDVPLARRYGRGLRDPKD